VKFQITSSETKYKTISTKNGIAKPNNAQNKMKVKALLSSPLNVAEYY